MYKEKTKICLRDIIYPINLIFMWNIDWSLWNTIKVAKVNVDILHSAGYHDKAFIKATKVVSILIRIELDLLK